MLRDDARYCDGCGQKLPPKAMLGQQTMSREEAATYRVDAPANPDGSVTIDLCLQCRIDRSNRQKRSS
jgi:hypothetical protein